MEQRGFYNFIYVSKPPLVGSRQNGGNRQNLMSSMSCTVQATQEEWFPALGDITVIGLLGSGTEMARRAAKQVTRGMHCFISSILQLYLI